MVKSFAKEFGLHPTEVMNNFDFGSYIELNVAMKEESEYEERKNHLWIELQK